MMNRRGIIPIFFILKNYSLGERNINIVNKTVFDPLGYENVAVDKCLIHNQHKRHTNQEVQNSSLCQDIRIITLILLKRNLVMHFKTGKVHQQIALSLLCKTGNSLTI